MNLDLAGVLGRNLRRLRTERGWTQAVLAEKMRAEGFRWHANRVGQLEMLSRPMSVLEFTGLTMVVGVTPDVLLAGDDLIEMPNGLHMQLGDFRAAFHRHS